MNVAIEKTENPAIRESADTKLQDPATNAPDIPTELAEEVFINENPERRLYRHSVAYFFFGFGAKKHSILTDEP